MRPDEILTLRDVADLLKVSPLTVHRLTKRGQLPGVKIGSQWRYWRGAIEELIQHPRPVDPPEKMRRAS